MEPLKLKVAPKTKISSWADLLREAERLENDIDDHGYHGWRSSGRRYCANVKVYSWGDLGKAIDKLGKIDPVIKDLIHEHFTEEEQGDIHNYWIEDSAEHLNEWFKGVAHSGPAYYDKLVESVKAGVPTCYPAIEGLPTKAAKINEIRRWQADDALFLEAFKAANDGDDIMWEGRSGGYITWDSLHNLNNWIEDPIRAATEATTGEEPYLTFFEARKEFWEIEREHNLNLALIDYLEAWAKRMDFQAELDYRVSNYYNEELKGSDYPNILQQHAELKITIDDSLKFGHCESGTMHWVGQHFPGRTSATVAELLAVDSKSKSSVRRLCRWAIQRHLAASTF